MKATSLICFILLVAISVVKYPATYWMGYEEKSLSLLADPVMMGIPWLLIALLFLTIWITSLVRKKDHRWTSLLLIVLVVLVGLERFAPPSMNLIVYGLRDRVMKDYSLDDLRHFAADVDKAGLLKNEDKMGDGTSWINHGDTSGLTPDQVAAYQHIKAKYGFMHFLDDGRVLTGPSIINYQNEKVVDFEWGGALLGHWGCSIALHGKNDSKADLGVTVPVSDDIFFFYEP